MPLSALRNSRVLHLDESLSVELLPDLRATLNTWTGFLQGEPYRQRMDLCLVLLEQSSAHSIIANVQMLRPLVTADQDWTNQDWAPRAARAGLLRMVVVQPRSVFSQLVVTQVVQKLDNSVMQVVQVAEITDALRLLQTFDR